MYSKNMSSINVPPTSLHSSISNDTVMRLEHVTKIYKLYSRPLYRVIEALFPNSKSDHYQEFYALKDVSFSIDRGQTIGIIGQNGSGKSTLLQVICGILQPSDGNLQVHGRISALLELGAGFNPDFTGRENVYLNGSILGVGRKEMEDRFDDITDFADIGDFIDQPVKTYSSGMYVRLAFAVAINVNPDILIVDEALSVGDTAFQSKCFAKFKEFQENGVTILFVTHSMDLVTRYCNNAILLDHGSVVKSGGAKSVVDEYNRRLVMSRNAVNPRSTDDDKLEVEGQDEENDSGNDDAIGADAVGGCQSSITSYARDLVYTINRDENRYGNGKAEIIQVGIESLSKDVKHSFVHGETYRFWFKTRFHERLENPIMAFTIKDTKGFDLTGTNTLFKNVDILTVEKGDILLTQFDQRMMLNPGGYLLSFGCAGYENGEYVVYDRRYDMITFEVVSDTESAGIFDLDSTIKVSLVNH